MYLHWSMLQVAAPASDRSAGAITLRSRRAARAAQRALGAQTRAERRQRRSARSSTYEPGNEPSVSFTVRFEPSWPVRSTLTV